MSNAIKLFACGVDWQHEIGHAKDYDGKQPLYWCIESLKKDSRCWESCGIVELKLSLVAWREKQDLQKGCVSWESVKRKNGLQKRDSE